MGEDRVTKIGYICKNNYLIRKVHIRAASNAKFALPRFTRQYVIFAKRMCTCYIVINILDILT